MKTEYLLFIYALNQERYLRVFLENGDVPMDNNASERASRGFCLGQKHFQKIYENQRKWMKNSMAAEAA